ncbi:O-antigen ligase family protein [Natronincola ferrireducens]|uniref:O-Antigen ligase n=1 Tax=Natronincola ferrireducens TaxID=393762 RepID=A0A1G8X564_9FIRM|nr:O-antigen ligase family protein [Natronincola ferrireducens]SDJ85584.1 O-Antigen ligase [Natronincola ferrireducens]
MKPKEFKQKTKENRSTIATKKEGKSLILFTLLAILLFYPPFFRGLFFQKEILITHILSFGLFTIYLINKVTKGEKISFNNPFDYIGLFFIVAYILPIVFRQWADLRGAIGLVLRYTNFFVVYLMVKEYAVEEKYKNWIVDIFILSGVGTAIIGLLGGAGYVTLQDVVLGNRISSTFQYPNTLAAFMMTLFFITAGKQAIENNNWKRNLYATAGFVMAFTFIFTYSRTAWVIFPIFALIYLVILPSMERVKTIFYYIAVIVPSLLLLQPFSSYTTNIEDKSPRAVLTVVIGIAIFLGIYIGAQLIIQKLQEKDFKKVYIGLAAVMVAFVILTTAAFNVTRPLTFDNSEATENKSNNIHRVIGSVEGNQDYNLFLNLEAVGNEENQWPWRIRIFSIDGEGQRQALLTRNGEVDEAGDILLPFTTNEDTEKLAIYFDNLYPGTQVTFYEAKLLTVDEEVVDTINLSYRFIPETIINRINVLDLNQQSFTTRVAYYRDSFKIFKNYPIFGAGGGAWHGLYAKYQSEPYFSTEAHNYFLQTLVEVGVIGMLLMLVFLGMLLALFMMAVKNRRTMEMTILFAIGSLLTHSGLDFNFSYLSIPLFMWGLMALVDVEPIKNLNVKIKEKLNKELYAAIPLVLILPFIFISFSFYGGHQSAVRAAEALQYEGDYEKGYTLLESAIARDGFNKDFRGDMARLQTMIGEQNQQQVWFQLAEENLLRALQYSPHNENLLGQLGQLYLSLGDFEKGFGYIEKMVTAAPLRPVVYETKANAYSIVANYYLDNGETEKAKEMFEMATGVVEDVEVGNSQAERTIQLNRETINTLAKNRYIKENIEKSMIKERVDNIIYIAYLDQHIDETRGLPNGWWTWNREGGNIQTELVEKGIRVVNDGKDLGILLTPQFQLEPSTTYGIDLKLGGDVEEHLQLLLHSRSGTAIQFSQRPLGKPNGEGTYSFTFTTTEDLEAGGQDLRFYHYGDSEKSYIVEWVALYKMD